MEAELHSAGGAGGYLERAGMKGRKGQEAFYWGDRQAPPRFGEVPASRAKGNEPNIPGKCSPLLLRTLQDCAAVGGKGLGPEFPLRGLRKVPAPSQVEIAALAVSWGARAGRPSYSR